MVETLVAVVPLAFAAAISPVVLMVGIALLGGPRPKLQTGAFAVGVFATTVLLFGLGFVASHLQRDGLEPGFMASRWAYLVVGLFLIAAAVVLIIKRPNPNQASQITDRLLTGNRSLLAFTATGVAVMITNASSFVVLIAIIHAIGKEQLPIAEEGIAFAVAAIITALPGTLPFATAVAGGETRRARLNQIGALTVRYGALIMASLWVVFGAANVLRFFGS